MWSAISIVRVIKFCIRSSCHPGGKFKARKKPKESCNE